MYRLDLSRPCVSQVPERTGKELVRLAPSVLHRSGIAYAFLQSIMWRKHDAFSEDTLAVLNELIQREDIWEELLEHNDVSVNQSLAIPST